MLKMSGLFTLHLSGVPWCGCVIQLECSIHTIKYDEVGILSAQLHDILRMYTTHIIIIRIKT